MGFSRNAKNEVRKIIFDSFFLFFHTVNCACDLVIDTIDFMYLCVCHAQWRIQDFPKGGIGLRRALFDQKCVYKNERIGSRGEGGERAPGTPLDPPMTPHPLWFVFSDWLMVLYILSDRIARKQRYVQKHLIKVTTDARVCHW